MPASTKPSGWSMYYALSGSSRPHVLLTKVPRSALHQARTYRNWPSVELPPPIRFVLTVRQLSGTNIQRWTIVSHHRHLSTVGVCLLKVTTLLLLQSRVIHPASCVNALQSYTSLRRRRNARGASEFCTPAYIYNSFRKKTMTLRDLHLVHASISHH